MAKFSNGWSSRAATSIAKPFATAPRSSRSGRCSVNVFSSSFTSTSRYARAACSVERRMDDVAGTVFAVEAAPFHGQSNGRIEGAAGFVCDRDREPHRLEQHGARGNGNPNLFRQALQLALGVEATAGCLDVLEPGDGARDRIVARRAFHIRCAMTDDLKADHRAHHGDRVDAGVSHFAFFNASATA